MKIQYVRAAVLTCAFTLICAVAPRSTVGQGANSPPLDPPYVIVTYPAVNPTTQPQSVTVPAASGISTLVGLQPDQVVQVIIQYPPSQALQLVNLEALDGGTVLPPALVTVPVPSPPPAPSPPPSPCQGCVPLGVPQSQPSMSLSTDSNATLSFTFVAGHTPGLSQVSLVQGSQELGVQFWVLDAQNPQNNPKVVTPENPSY